MAFRGEADCRRVRPAARRPMRTATWTAVEDVASRGDRVYSQRIAYVLPHWVCATGQVVRQETRAMAISAITEPEQRPARYGPSSRDASAVPGRNGDGNAQRLGIVLLELHEAEHVRDLFDRIVVDEEIEVAVGRGGCRARESRKRKALSRRSRAERRRLPSGLRSAHLGPWRRTLPQQRAESRLQPRRAAAGARQSSRRRRRRSPPPS